MGSGQTDLEGRRIADRYELQEQLASGGMGGLWLAVDEVLGRSVAVKVLHDHLAGDAELLERFRLEAVAAARLSHPAVVRVFDTGIDDGLCYIVMELVDGRSVADVLAEEGAVSSGEAARIMRGVLQALAHAHREGVIHRDVKPANILLGRDGLVKLADFGIAKAAFAEGDVTTTGDLLGTSRYLSPEQVTGGEIDGRSDLYAAGVVLYEMLTGRPPFDADTHIATATLRLTSDPAPPRSLRPGIPRQVEAVVMRSLAREPDARFHSAEEMSSALEHAVPAAGPPRAERTELISEHLPERRSLVGWLMIPLVLALVAGLVVGGFLLLEGPGGDEGRQPPESLPGGAAIETVATHSYDPPPGDGAEHDDTLAGAIDGDPATSWTTEGYFSADVGGLKEGVGLVVELATEANVGAISIESDLSGWEFSAYAGDGPDSFDLDTPIGGPFTVEPGATYQVEATEARYVLVWITGLTPADEGRFRATINEIELLPPGA